MLSRTDDVVLFESERRIGGHAHTHQLSASGQTGGGSLAAISVDSGFIVHNRRTYPLLTRLLAELGVAVQSSEMSMSVSCAGCGLQYAGHRGLPGLAAGLRAGGGRYARMLGEVAAVPPRGAAADRPPGRHHPGTGRPDAAAVPAVADGAAPAELTLGQFLEAGGYSRYFIAHFALPFVAAVWSCPPQTALSYPARYLFTFLNHHGLLSVTGSPPWLTITGGSRSYVERVAKQLAAVRTGARCHRRAPADGHAPR